MLVPSWVWLLAGATFGASAFLALHVAPLVYGNVLPSADGPRPMRLPAIVPVVAATLLGSIFAWRGSTWPVLLFLDAIVFMLCAVVWTDMTRGIVGDWFTYPAIVLALLVSTFAGTIVPVALSAALVTLPFVVAAIASKGMGMGWGDVKLIALGAILLDTQTSIVLFAATCIVACLVAFAGKRRREPIAFAPYLAVAIALGLLMPDARHVG